MDKVFYGILSKQRERYIINGSIKAKDLLGIYKIDEWEKGKPIEKQGCQRPPVAAHYKKIGRQFSQKDFWLPTSIVLSESAKLTNDKVNDFQITKVDNKFGIPLVKFVLKNGYKLRVVDGQHRIKGIEYAINDKHIEDVKDFELPYVLMLTKNRVDEIQSFYEINSTPKKVATDLALQLLNEIEDSEDRDTGKLPASKLNSLIALRASMNLNDDSESVWYKDISVGKTKNNDSIVSSTSFVNSLKPLISGKNQSKVIISSITNIYDGSAKTTKSNMTKDQMGNILSDIISNFWNAIKVLMPDAFPIEFDLKQRWVVQKTPGVFALNLVAGKVLDLMFYRAQIKKLNTKNIIEFLEKYSETGVKDYKNYWRGSNKRENIIGGEASRANSQQGFKQLAEDIYGDIEANYNDKNNERPIFD